MFTIAERWKTDSFVTPAIARKYDFEVPDYQGVDQFVEVGAGSARKL